MIGYLRYFWKKMIKVNIFANIKMNANGEEQTIWVSGENITQV